MFAHVMLEGKASEVEITDVDAIVMQQVLAFIYSGKAPSLDKMADELLPAADKVNDIG